ncbi:MAG: hypothetical protein AB8I52_11265 [Candidatus Promineifilaceae bacterium]
MECGINGRPTPNPPTCFNMLTVIAANSFAAALPYNKNDGRPPNGRQDP